jgi:hypothetical protein
MIVHHLKILEFAPSSYLDSKKKKKKKTSNAIEKIAQIFLKFISMIANYFHL